MNDTCSEWKKLAAEVGGELNEAAAAPSIWAANGAPQIRVAYKEWNIVFTYVLGKVPYQELSVECFGNSTGFSFKLLSKKALESQAREMARVGRLQGKQSIGDRELDEKFKLYSENFPQAQAFLQRNAIRDGLSNLNKQLENQERSEVRFYNPSTQGRTELLIFRLFSAVPARTTIKAIIQFMKTALDELVASGMISPTASSITSAHLLIDPATESKFQFDQGEKLIVRANPSKRGLVKDALRTTLPLALVVALIMYLLHTPFLICSVIFALFVGIPVGVHQSRSSKIVYIITNQRIFLIDHGLSKFAPRVTEVPLRDCRMLRVSSSNPGHTIKLACSSVNSNFQDANSATTVGDKFVFLACKDDSCLNQIQTLPLLHEESPLCSEASCISR